MKGSRFITFEGVEGSGKTTQIGLLSAFLGSRGIEVLMTREPGGTTLGERLRDLLLDPAHPPLPLAELFMLEAARTQIVATVIRPALEKGTWVLCDRFADSSLAYQGAARGLGVELVRDLNRVACQGLTPDRTIVLGLEPATAITRARQRASTTAGNRRFEDENLEFHCLVGEAFRQLAELERARVRLVDATGSVDEVHSRVLTVIEDLLC